MIGKVIVKFDGDTETTAAGGTTAAFDEEMVYGVAPPFTVNTTLDELHCDGGTAAIAGMAALPPR